MYNPEVENDPRELENYKMSARASIESHRRAGKDILLLNPDAGQEGQVNVYFGKSSKQGKPGYGADQAISLDDPRALELVAKELMRVERAKRGN